jgi:hypothetical protein
MTVLTYRGQQYSKEDEARANVEWWNLAHRPALTLTYRGHDYRPFITGGTTYKLF